MSIHVRVFSIGLVAMMFLIVVHASARSVSDADGAWTWSDAIQFPASLHRDVEQMLRGSATFRAQYRRIAEAGWVVVGVTIDPTLCEGVYRARSTVKRYKSGVIVAAVVIRPGSHEAEWIAHEFEHIVEQIEGRQVRQLASARGTDVWYSGVDMIETGRAIRAGLAVREELQQPRTSQ